MVTQFDDAKITYLNEIIKNIIDKNQNILLQTKKMIIKITKFAVFGPLSVFCTHPIKYSLNIHWCDNQTTHF